MNYLEARTFTLKAVEVLSNGSQEGQTGLVLAEEDPPQPPSAECGECESEECWEECAAPAGHGAGGKPQEGGQGGWVACVSWARRNFKELGWES